MRVRGAVAPATAPHPTALHAMPLRVRGEQRLPELLDAVGLDDTLARADDPVGERLRALGVVGANDRDDAVLVEEGLVALGENLQRESTLQIQVRRAIGERVALGLRRDLEDVAHALPGRLVPV